MKTNQNKLSLEQEDWLGFLNAQNYKAVCVYGWQEAAVEILNYLEL